MDHENNETIAPGFLKRTAGSGAALLAVPSVVSAAVLGSNSPNSRIGVGFIGTGRQAYHANLLPFLVAPETQVVAVCDVDRWRMEQARRRVEDHYAVTQPGYRGCGVAGDFRELLARADVDAVVISTPDHWHAVMAVAAARAGKHIALEKPISLSIRQGRAIADAAKHQGVIFAPIPRCAPRRNSASCGNRAHGADWQSRARGGGCAGRAAAGFRPAGNAGSGGAGLCGLAGAGAWAPYTEQRVHARENLRARPGWMIIPDYCEGMICNWGAHLIDIVQWTLGDGRIRGRCESRGTGCFTRRMGCRACLGHSRFGTRMPAEWSWTIEWRGVRLCASREHWVGWKRNGGRVYRPVHPTCSREPIESDGLTTRQVNEKLDFIDSIKANRPTLIPAEAGHRTNSLCQLGLISIQLGRALAWDPVREELKDDAEGTGRLDRPLRAPWRIDPGEIRG
jgi:myo-inositol 2-dehydrogenase / D-chiro-inositol 1-dehydrogenase